MVNYRATIHEATGFTMNRLMFRREVALPVDLVYGVHDIFGLGVDVSNDDYVNRIYQRASGDFETAR